MAHEYLEDVPEVRRLVTTSFSPTFHRWTSSRR